MAVTDDDDWLVVLAVGTTTPFESAQPLVQAIGTTTFALVDVTVTDASDLTPGDRLSGGPGMGDRVVGIERPLTYYALPAVVQGVLGPLIERIITRNEGRFIEAFNTTILDGHDGHPLALLPGLSADCQAAIVAERSQRRFTDGADLTTRVTCCEHPWSLLAERVMLELRESEAASHWLTA